MRVDRVPVNEPLLGETAEQYVSECLKTGWVSSEGPYVEAFEQRWAEYCGMPYGVAVSNGTTALAVAVEALELPPGAEVIMPTFTIISCALAVVEAGLTPVLVDSDPSTWCMDLDHVSRVISSRTAAIMAVHMYGHPVDMDRLHVIAAECGAKVIEDAAEAHGAECRGRKVGGLGDVSCFSFYANKIITTGEGGMVLTASEILRDRLRSARNLAFNRERRFLHYRLGHNYRLTNMQAALGLSQIEAIEEHVRRKRWAASRYVELLSGVEGLMLPAEASWAKNVYWMFGIVLNPEVPFDALELARRLSEDGVDTRPFFVGMHRQPALERFGLKAGAFPVADRLTERGLYLPSGLTLTDDQIERVAAAVRRAIRN
jgi:perosamine synthetase